METLSDCKGCKVLDNRCYLRTSKVKSEMEEVREKFVERCPCRLCIVKVICNGTCDLYSEYAGEFHSVTEYEEYKY